MGVSHRYRRFALRGPLMVMRARRGAASVFACLLVSYKDASSSIKLNRFCVRCAPSRLK